MKKLLLLTLAASSVSANMNTWYQPGSYPEYPQEFMRSMHEIQGDYRYYRFESDLRKNQNVLDEFRRNSSTGIISYLLYEDDKIIIDEITPKDRFGIIFDDNIRNPLNFKSKP